MSANFYLSSHANYHLHPRAAIVAARSEDLKHATEQELGWLEIWSASGQSHARENLPLQSRTDPAFALPSDSKDLQEIRTAATSQRDCNRLLQKILFKERLLRDGSHSGRRCLLLRGSKSRGNTRSRQKCSGRS